MKKRIYISGQLLYPLKEGQRAVIKHGGDFIRTSKVVDILEVTLDYVRFETMNTVYQVSTSPVKSEVHKVLPMCA